MIKFTNQTELDKFALSIDGPCSVEIADGDYDHCTIFPWDSLMVQSEKFLRKFPRTYLKVLHWINTGE